MVGIDERRMWPRTVEALLDGFAAPCVPANARKRKRAKPSGALIIKGLARHNLWAHKFFFKKNIR